MKKLLITGAYGLVGSNICKLLERDHPDVEVTKVKCDIGEANGDFFDLNEPVFDKSILSKDYDYVIHAAGYGQPQMFSNDKIQTMAINTRQTSLLFELIKPYGTFLFVSTSEVYSGAPSPHKETDIGTTTPQHPRACYIEGKRCGEAICMAYKEQGYDVKIARLALAYGPGTKKGDTRVLNQFIEQALTTGEIRMKDDGSAKRTYIYVEDAAGMILDVLFKGVDVVYNIGGLSKLTIKDIADYVGAQTGARIIVGDKPLEGSPDSVDLDISKMQDELPRKFVDFGTGIRKTIEYQKTIYG